MQHNLHGKKIAPITKQNMNSTHTKQQPTVAYFTLGCRLNQADTALIKDNLRQHNFTTVPWKNGADVMIINTCTVTAAATRKSRQTARATRKQYPNAFIIVVGCSTTTEEKYWETEKAVNLIIQNPDKISIFQHLPKKLQATHNPIFKKSQTPKINQLFTIPQTGYYPEKTRANLKIQEGCNFFCSYCIVPYARGVPRSRKWEDILREAKTLITQGYKELVLTGVNIATYNDHNRNLAQLLIALTKLNGNFRIRLGSTEPGPIFPQIVDIMQNNPKICKFLHLPIQYAQDTMLQAMNRRYTVAEFRKFAQDACNKIPTLCIGTDLIVGFPGETDHIFNQCYQNIQNMPIHYIHVFSYSKRPGTPAATFPNQVHNETTNKRHKTMQKLADKKSKLFAQSNIGRKLEIIIENRDNNNNCSGLSDNFLQVTIPNSHIELCENTLITAKIISAESARKVVAILSDTQHKKKTTIDIAKNQTKATIK